MANFTESEANACTITRLEKKMTGGSYTNMIIGVTDADGNYYDWSDIALKEDATKAEIKSAVATQLQSMDKQPAPVVTTYKELADKGKGETVG
jgi:hypothetical protein